MSGSRPPRDCRERAAPPSPGVALRAKRLGGKRRVKKTERLLVPSAAWSQSRRRPCQTRMIANSRVETAASARTTRAFAAERNSDNDERGARSEWEMRGTRQVFRGARASRRSVGASRGDLSLHRKPLAVRAALRAEKPSAGRPRRRPRRAWSAAHVPARTAPRRMARAHGPMESSPDPTVTAAGPMGTAPYRTRRGPHRAATAHAPMGTAAYWTRTAPQRAGTGPGRTRTAPRPMGVRVKPLRLAVSGPIFTPEPKPTHPHT